MKRRSLLENRGRPNIGDCCLKSLVLKLMIGGIKITTGISFFFVVEIIIVGE